MLNEGLHVDNTDGIVMLRPTDSHVIFLQQLGRALSVKNEWRPLVIDIVNNINSYENIYQIREMKLLK